MVIDSLTRAVQGMCTPLVMDGRRRKTRLDQLDPSTVDDNVVGGGRDGHGPTEVVRDPETHG
jgi:hypothetical protein